MEVLAQQVVPMATLAILLPKRVLRQIRSATNYHSVKENVAHAICRTPPAWFPIAKARKQVRCVPQSVLLAICPSSGCLHQ